MEQVIQINVKIAPSVITSMCRVRMLSQTVNSAEKAHGLPLVPIVVQIALKENMAILSRQIM